MQTVKQKQRLRYQVRCPKLPLTVYREVAAHLRQVEGVDTGLIPTHISPDEVPPEFDYTQSQVGSLWIEYDHTPNREIRQRIDQILAYYNDRYGAWETIDLPQD
ncbi:hypothetical protein [Planktothrix paucivesiculata]|uniref:Uncharacterized protein n=1 Tax=Planktothrix paucivesiculata PCC 9631 TaxID=671071 RepID=A0A7Z9E1A3_9CYAN|nr:hypothetical protein [Planktothrix paucivesiculata]VXD20734.1 conserved hypothetical protein [Planktothrix paucivesiculata PCC 9631]